MRNYLKRWNARRILWLVAAIAIAVQGIITREWIFVAMGVVGSLMPILNMGCACNVPSYRQSGVVQGKALKKIIKENSSNEVKN